LEQGLQSRINRRSLFESHRRDPPPCCGLWRRAAIGHGAPSCGDSPLATHMVRLPACRRRWLALAESQCNALLPQPVTRRIKLAYPVDSHTLDLVVGHGCLAVKICRSAVSAGVPAYFPDDAACAPISKAPAGRSVRLPKVRRRWRAVPFRGAPGRSALRACRKDVSLMAGTVMERSHTPLSTWFWAAYLIASQTPGSRPSNFSGSSPVALRDGLRILHKLRAAWCAPSATRLAASRKSSRSR